MKHKVFLSLGSNLGNKEGNVIEAISRIRELIGDVERQSTLLVTQPWGFESENTFVNAAIMVVTDMQPLQLLHATQQIERDMGRTEKSVAGCYRDRIIDIDILTYDDLHIATDELTLPHPLMHERDFVMKPLREIL